MNIAHLIKRNLVQVRLSVFSEAAAFVIVALTFLVHTLVENVLYSILLNCMVLLLPCSLCTARPYIHQIFSKN